MVNNISLFFMAGTEGTGKFIVIAATSRARVGFRPIAGDRFRIRVEPGVPSSESEFTPSPAPAGELTTALTRPSWKQPDAEQNRFSIVVIGEKALREQLAVALRAACTAGGESVAFIPVVNPAAPEWARHLVIAATTPAPADDTAERTALIAKLRAAKVKGVNSRWGTPALRAAAAKLPVDEAAERTALIATLRAANAKGVNSRWGTPALRAAVAKLSS